MSRIWPECSQVVITLLTYFPIFFSEKLQPWIIGMTAKNHHVQRTQLQFTHWTSVSIFWYRNFRILYAPTKTLEQEFFLFLMRLRLGLLVEDLAFRFYVSAGKVSKIVITWVILLFKKLKSLIIWYSRARIRSILLGCFKRLYPNVRIIIECSEIFFDTPSSLDMQGCLWSDYRHHCTVKFLIANTTNGAVYGGRVSDIHMVRGSSFLGDLRAFRWSYGR